MFLDASAIIAILAEEDEAEAFTAILDAATVRLSSPLAVYEAATGLARRRGRPLPWAQDVVTAFLQTADVAVVSIGIEEEAEAIDAFDRFGKGRHPAGLNMGDCFAYACARTHGVPLLFKGDDFSKTDIARA
jgi:ribonuclease VapC